MAETETIHLKTPRALLKEGDYKRKVLEINGQIAKRDAERCRQ